ncbi:hypothetical protein CAURIS_10665 [Corynebacterium auris]|nr:hypothetical protein CAURIS_10665 [Corynebacterium auris]
MAFISGDSDVRIHVRYAFHPRFFVDAVNENHHFLAHENTATT